MQPRRVAVPLAAAACALAALSVIERPHPVQSGTPSSTDFTNFESDPIHPICLSPNGQKLFALDIPDARLEVFSVTPGGLTLLDEIPVGLEPVSVAARTDNEVWVVDHLSDDIAIVDVAAGNVVKTLRVGDEPTDVVFAKTSAAPNAPRVAFVCLSAEDRVKVFDPTTLAPVGSPVAIFSDDPRALALSPDTTQVYVAAFESGNKTTVVRFQDVQSGAGLPPPSPPMRADLPPRPNVALIVRHDGTHWVDELGRSWDASVPYSLPDKDVFVIDGGTRAIVREVTGVGTLLFNLAPNPVSGKLFVANTEAMNAIRFEPNLRGSFVRNRVSIVDPATGAVTPIHLNGHINYATTPGPPSEIALSLAQPTDVRFTPNGAKAYLAAFGSNKVGVLDGTTAAVTGRIAVGKGPVGLAMASDGLRLYVLNRFDSSISIVSPVSDQVLATVPLGFDPTPPVIASGRPFLYDASITSGHGDASCASCHAFSNFDNIAWDLGNPQGNYQNPPPNQIAGAFLQGFHPMKGPMTTQTLRGLGDIGLMHWRADRANFLAFNGAFVGLMGRADSLSAGDMQAYSDFIQTVRFGPNPARFLDRSLPNPASGPSAFRGENEFMNVQHDGNLTCNNCHLVPTGTNDQVFPNEVLLEDQDIKVPQLRNLFEKNHMSRNPGSLNRAGYGFTHDGAMDNLVNFLRLPVFQFNGGDPQRADVEAFLLAFDTGTAPAVGRRITLGTANKNLAETVSLLDTLYARASAGDCDVIVLGKAGGLRRGYLYDAVAANFQPDRASEPRLSKTALRALALDGSELTWFGVPPGSGLRMALDRDRDGYYDRDEIDAGSSPANPAQTPPLVAVGPGDLGPRVSFAGGLPNPFASGATTSLRFTLASSADARLEVFDASGRRVTTLLDRRMPAGPSAVTWDGTDASGRETRPGVYFYRLSALGMKVTAKGIRL
jgi:YVTN family beta-propeller protein